MAASHINSVADEIGREFPDLNTKIVEIGCGRGELLSRLRNGGYRNLRGYDPAAPEIRAGFIARELWNGQETGVELFVLRHTLEAITGLTDFVQSIAAALAPSGSIFCEITNARCLLRHQDIFSLFPENSNFFSASSIARLFMRHRVSVDRVAPYFDGEWLGIWARKFQSPKEIFAIEKSRARLREGVRSLMQPVILWGIGGRGEDFLSFLKADQTLIAKVVDMNKAKQGLFVPPFGQEIVSPEILADLRPGTILVSNKRYLDEIISMAPSGCRIMTIDDLVGPLAGFPQAATQ